MSQEPSSNSVSHRETREEGPSNSGERGIVQGMEPKKKIRISEIEGVPVKITLQIGALEQNVHELEETQEFLLEQNNTIVVQLSKAESERNELKKRNADLEKALKTIKGQVEELQFSKTKNAAEPEGLETPVAQPPQDEVQGTGMWHRGAKCLLKVGLGLATAALIVPAAFWVFSKMST